MKEQLEKIIITILEAPAVSFRIDLFTLTLKMEVAGSSEMLGISTTLTW